MNATTTTELPTPPALASVSGSTAPLDESLKAFRKEQGDWRLMEHLMGWLCRLQKDSKVTKGDYAGDDFRITIKVR